MVVNVEETVKSSQEQAVASWINYLNQIRIDQLLVRLTQEQDNLQNAQKAIHEALEIIDKDIVNNGLGRGGAKGMHGFIAEVAQVGVGNAKNLIEGLKASYEWVDDNGIVDLIRDGTPIQQKFSAAGGHLSLQAVLSHMEKYPDYLGNGGKYQIPSDHYDRIKWLLSIPEDQANKMPTATGEFSLTQWREVHELVDNNVIPMDALEPSDLSFSDVQREAYEHTMAREETKLKERNEERRGEAYQESKPSFQEGAKASAVAAGIEASTAFIRSIIKKRRSGKRIQDFNIEDWKEIGVDTGGGAAKGGIRGASVYLMTNFTATPAAVANSVVTASFSIAEQAHQFRTGSIDEVEFIENSEIVCLDAAVSAVSSLLGQAVIPVPVLGAIIGNAVGTMVYKVSMDSLSEKEQTIIKEYENEIDMLNVRLNFEYEALLSDLAKDMELYLNILDRAFSVDPIVALSGSVDLARRMGVPSEEILDTKERIDAYFLD